MTTQLQSLHSAWNSATGQDLNYRATERIWWEMAKMDFTPEDLTIVLVDVMQYNKSHAACPMKIQVHKLCCDLEIFASLLASAKAKARNKIKIATPKEAVIEAFRPSACERVTGNNVHKISEFLKLPHQ